jgi:hypothetical protein
VYTSLVPTHFSVSDQLVSSDLFSAHGSGSREEMAQEGDRGGRTQRAKRVQPINLKTIVVLQTKGGTVNSK